MVRLITLLLAAVSVYADEATLQFEQANILYRNGEIESAARVYEQILSNGYEDAALYYNLGNCYFKANKIPLAVLNYERAKRLAPGDDDIRHNLRLANLRLVDKVEPIPRLFLIAWWDSFVNLYSSDTWASISIIVLWLTVVSGSVFLISRSPAIRRTLFLIAIVTGFIFVITFFNMIQRNRIENSFNEAIVITQSVLVKSAPDDKSTDLFVLHEGVKVELLDSVGEWKKIRLADGKVGWLPEVDLLVI